jgi:two-component system chemotaxis response regulator CheB
METSNQSPGEPWAITLAASAGGLNALTTILRALPEDLPAAVIVLQHRTAGSGADHLRDILGRAAAMPVVVAEQEQAIQPARVYVARPDLHLTVSAERRFSYVDGRRIRFLLSSANPLFESAAAASRVISLPSF